MPLSPTWLTRLLAGSLACAVPALACAQPSGITPELRPGAWQVRSGAPGQPMVGYMVCLKDGTQDLRLLLPRVQPPAPCGPAVMRIEGSELTWELSCPAQALVARARYTLAAEKVEGRLTAVSGTPPQSREEMISASYAGACAQP